MNVIFCSLDTLRADRLGVIGGRPGLTPNLDRLAGEGALFTQAFATDIPTQPSHTALFTGRYGIRTGIVSHFHPHAKLDETEPWLPSTFQAAGYHTGAVDHLFAMKDWFIRGYTDYMPPPGRSRSPAGVINEIAFPWIADHRDEDFFLLLHYWDAHIPYVPPSPFKERFTAASAEYTDPLVEQQLRSRPSYPLFWQNHYQHLGSIPSLEYVSDLYDAEVAYLDFEIGRLFDHLAAQGILDDTMVVLFGDHGENLTEHDAWFDHAGLYDTVTHVPLIIWAPGRVPAVTVDAMVGLLDVMPTMLELTGLPEATGLDGRSLMPLVRGERTTHRASMVLSECTWQAKRAVRTDRWKFIRSYDPGIYPRGGIELYDLYADPTEQFDLSEERPELVKQLSAELDHWLEDNLAGRPDPMFEVISEGLPAVRRLDRIIASGHDGTVPAKPSEEDQPSQRHPALVGAFSAPELAQPATVRPVAGNGDITTLRPVAAATATNGASVSGAGSSEPRRPGARRAVFVSAAVVLAVSALGFGVDSVFLAGPVQAAGVVAPVDAAQLDFGVSGPVTQIDVHPGQVVQAGTVLASEDTSALNATLAAAEAKLNADQADAQQNAQLGTPAQAQQLQAQVNQAQAQLAAARSKVADATTTDNAAVTAAQTQVQDAQATLSTDQMWAGAACTTTCATQARQLAVDQGTLNSAQAAYQQALATRSADIDGANAQVAVASAAVSSAQAGQAVGLLPSSTASVNAAATVAADEAAIASAKEQLSQAVLTAPFTGVVASVNGVVGDYATPQGIKPLSSPSPLPQPPSSGIAIFPQAPQAQSQAQPQLASMITLDSLQSQIITQVPETQISTVKVGGPAQVSLPAMPGQHFTATVRQIQPTAVYVSGQAFFLVDLVVSSNQSRTDTGGHVIVEKLVSDNRSGTKSLAMMSFSRNAKSGAGPGYGVSPFQLTGLSADVSF